MEHTDRARTSPGGTERRKASHPTRDRRIRLRKQLTEADPESTESAREICQLWQIQNLHEVFPLNPELSPLSWGQSKKDVLLEIARRIPRVKAVELIVKHNAARVARKGQLKNLTPGKWTSFRLEDGRAVLEELGMGAMVLDDEVQPPALGQVARPRNDQISFHGVAPPHDEQTLGDSRTRLLTGHGIYKSIEGSSKRQGPIDVPTNDNQGDIDYDMTDIEYSDKYSDDSDHNAAGNLKNNSDGHDNAQLDKPASKTIPPHIFPRSQGVLVKEESQTHPSLLPPRTPLSIMQHATGEAHFVSATQSNPIVDALRGASGHSLKDNPTPVGDILCMFTSISECGAALRNAEQGLKLAMAKSVENNHALVAHEQKCAKHSAAEKCLEGYMKSLSTVSVPNTPSWQLLQAIDMMTTPGTSKRPVAHGSRSNIANMSTFPMPVDPFDHAIYEHLKRARDLLSDSRSLRTEAEDSAEVARMKAVELSQHEQQRREAVEVAWEQRRRLERAVEAMPADVRAPLRNALRDACLGDGEVSRGVA